MKSPIISIDEQALEPLHSFACDRKGELWKRPWHKHRWGQDAGYTKNAGSENVPKPREVTLVSETIANAQTGVGNRIEFWTERGTPMDSAEKIRRFLDVGRPTERR
jgi:hypothetical protein